jgi:Domain of unknown function (DUF4249)
MKKLFSLLIIWIISSSCSERYNLETNTYEESLVVEATITNELKTQEVKLTKTYRLEAYGPTVETGANVYVSDNLGNQYTFAENSGTYRSINPFQALPGRNYQLHFTTSNGKSYESAPEQTPTATQIQDVTTEVVTKDGVRGVQMSAQSFDPTNTSKYYRYEYEETYKIIAPKWSFYKGQVTDVNNVTELFIVPRTTEAKTCYKTEFSKDIILTNTNDLSEDRVNLPIRFINQQNYIITHRYRILVRQYIQNLSSRNYYSTLKLITASGNSVLSQNQPGLLNGNLKNLNDPKERIVGFFDVSTVSTKVIYFNYADLFPGQQAPPYYTDCSEEILPSIQRNYKYCFVGSLSLICEGNEIISWISSGQQTYRSGASSNGLPVLKSPGTSIELFPSPCGDCTSFNNNSNIRPTFWID